MERENLISYAMSFASFLLDERIGKNIDRIVLFGSVARGDFDMESDIDLFVETKGNIEGKVSETLSLFRHSEIQRKWELKGIKNEISVKVGNIDKWKLKRDILTDGIILYGKLKDIPENTEYYLLLATSFRRFSKSHKVRLWRRLYGYRQKVGRNVYKTEGLVEKLGGKRVESGIIIPVAKKKELLDFLNKEKISYTLNEIWSDNL
jgi:predicted nucleotidyltransferase